MMASRCLSARHDGATHGQAPASRELAWRNNESEGASSHISHGCKVSAADNRFRSLVRPENYFAEAALTRPQRAERRPPRYSQAKMLVTDNDSRSSESSSWRVLILRRDSPQHTV